MLPDRYASKPALPCPARRRLFPDAAAETAGLPPAPLPTGLLSPGLAGCGLLDANADTLLLDTALPSDDLNLLLMGDPTGGLGGGGSGPWGAALGPDPGHLMSPRSPSVPAFGAGLGGL